MPINRKGKHWCDPASEEPNRYGNWTCPDCKIRWHWWPEQSTWAQSDEDLTPVVPEPIEEPAAPADKEGEG